jgi:predicted DNA-binding antitoxin AbrB/MazE fold protein
MSKTVHAIFENGVFRPTGPVELPEGCEVQFEPRAVNAAPTTPTLDEVYAILARRFDSGEHDLAVNPPHAWDQAFADKLAVNTNNSEAECQVTRDDLLF